MKNIIIPVIMLSLFTSIGCMNDSGPEIESTGPVPTIVLPETGDTNANKIQTVPVTTTAPAITSKPVSAAELNPAHGQPGHRCDIAVGAPLDSKPVQTTIQSQPTATQTTPVISAGTGINPAHGQPGHRCDIPVGSPLNSKPAQ